MSNFHFYFLSSFSGYPVFWIFSLSFFHICPIFISISCLPSPGTLSFGYFPFLSSIYVQFSLLFLVFLLQVPCLLDIFLFFLQYMSNFPPFSNHSASHCYQIWIYCHQKCSLCPIHLREYINCALKKNIWKHISSIPSKRKYLETHKFCLPQKENIRKHISAIPPPKKTSRNT